jgi:hypothetical protein
MGTANCTPTELAVGEWRQPNATNVPGRINQGERRGNYQGMDGRVQETVQAPHHWRHIGPGSCLSPLRGPGGSTGEHPGTATRAAVRPPAINRIRDRRS